MSQPSDSASDLGQELPTGLLSHISCGEEGPPTADETATTHCQVSWQTVDGEQRETRYLVRLFPTGCFAAGARPPFPKHRDATIASYSEHPLNALVSVEENCS